MKKIVALILAVMMCVGFAFAETTLGQLGAWQVAEDTTVTEERQAVFDKALEGLVGVNYVPVAYLASQLVSGTNHCFLCTATVVYPGAPTTLVLVYIYEDLEGNAQFTNFVDIDIAALSSVAAE